ncbi:hypothetical protein D1007_09642 [Hordeum vulgare]|nr:hypothetical protein D1007_09642 [Hordeum vulgare]
MEVMMAGDNLDRVLHCLFIGCILGGSLTWSPKREGIGFPTTTATVYLLVGAMCFGDSSSGLSPAHSCVPCLCDCGRQLLPLGVVKPQTTTMLVSSVYEASGSALVTSSNSAWMSSVWVLG